jgi:hypothetical protein
MRQAGRAICDVGLDFGRGLRHSEVTETRSLIHMKTTLKVQTPVGEFTRTTDTKYCIAHQGNASHYDPQNCTVCNLLAALRAIAESAPALPLKAKSATALRAVARAAIAKAVQS